MNKNVTVNNTNEYHKSIQTNSVEEEESDSEISSVSSFGKNDFGGFAPLYKKDFLDFDLENVSDVDSADIWDFSRTISSISSISDSSEWDSSFLSNDADTSVYDSDIEDWNSNYFVKSENEKWKLNNFTKSENDCKINSIKKESETIAKSESIHTSKKEWKMEHKKDEPKKDESKYAGSSWSNNINPSNNNEVEKAELLNQILNNLSDNMVLAPDALYKNYRDNITCALSFCDVETIGIIWWCCT